MPDSHPDRVVPARSDTSTDSSRSRAGSRLKVGVPTVIALVAVGSVPLALGGGGGGGGDETVRSADEVTTDSTTPDSVASDSIFTPAGTTTKTSPIATTTPTTTPTTAVAATAPTTVDTTSSSIASVPVTVAETLPVQPSEPIAPPADPRGFEEQIQLGGISIPKIGLDAPLLSGIRLTTLDNGPGHWPGTALPGEVGNVVVAAHRTSHSAEFRNIDQLVEGDVVLFDTGDGEVEYTVTETLIVYPDALWIVDPSDTATATLFACHPPGSVAQRIVVKLELAA